MATLRTRLDSLAQSFADSVLAAIRGASLDELLSEGGNGSRAPRAVRAPATARPARSGVAKGTIRNGRLARRSAADVEQTLGRVLAVLARSPMRAEQIRDALSLDRRELPRVLALGVSKRWLTKKGQKRATTYAAVPVAQRIAAAGAASRAQSKGARAVSKKPR